MCLSFEVAVAISGILITQPLILSMLRLLALVYLYQKIRQAWLSAPGDMAAMNTDTMSVSVPLVARSLPSDTWSHFSENIVG